MFQYEEHFRILAVRKLEQEQNTWGGSCSPNRALLNVALARERLLCTNNFRRCLSFELDCSTFFQPSGYFADLIPQLSEKRVMFQMAKILTNLKTRSSRWFCATLVFHMPSHLLSSWITVHYGAILLFFLKSTERLSSCRP